MPAALSPKSAWAQQRKRMVTQREEAARLSADYDALFVLCEQGAHFAREVSKAQQALGLAKRLPRRHGLRRATGSARGSAGRALAAAQNAVATDLLDIHCDPGVAAEIRARCAASAAKAAMHHDDVHATAGAVARSRI